MYKLFIIIGFTTLLASCRNTDTNKSTEYLPYVLSDSTNSIKNVQVLSEIIGPIQYSDHPSSDGQFSYKSYISEKLEVQLIPNRGQRKLLNVKEINNIVGVNHFLIDHDLTTGFVHQYTQNFYNRLRPGDFVLKYERSANDKNNGYVSYIRKSDVKSDDKVGQSLAVFRQWRLSEIDFLGDSIKVAKCAYAQRCVCPLVKPSSDNPFKPQIPIWSVFDKEGYYSLNNFNKLDRIDGGTVAIVWENPSTKRIMFMDVHGSLQMIMKTAFDIANNYGVDPAIAISDAGPFAIKFKSDSNSVLSTSLIDNISDGPNFGAGFGYTPVKLTVFELTYNNGKKRNDTVPNNTSYYQELIAKLKKRSL